MSGAVPGATSFVPRLAFRSRHDARAADGNGSYVFPEAPTERQAEFGPAAEEELPAPLVQYWAHEDGSPARRPVDRTPLWQSVAGLPENGAAKGADRVAPGRTPAPPPEGPEGPDPGGEVEAVPEDPFPNDAAWKKSWRQWTAFVENLAHGRSYPPGGEPAYRELRRRLLVGCRCRAARAGGPARALFRTVEAVLEPWLTLEALAYTDRATLQSLLLRCRQLDRELAVSPGIHVGRWVAVVLVVLLVAAGGWALRGLAGQAPYAAPATRLVKDFFETNSILLTIIGLPVVLTAVVYLVSRFLRT